LPNLNAADHLYAVGNYDPLTIELYSDLWDRIEGEPGTPPGLDEILPLLNILSARYVVSEDRVTLPEIYGAGPRIYRNDMALPQAYVVTRAQVVEDSATRLAVLLNPTFDPRSEVLLSRAPATALGQQAAAAKESVTSPPVPSVQREGPQSIQVRVNMPQAGYLVLNDVYYPGWRATVDGQPAEILPANHAFRAVALAQGEHIVAFQYAPFSFRLGASITFAALLLATALTVGWLLRRHR
jgi:hypothetical protein